MTTTNTYKTKQRETILNYLQRNKDKHLTIEDVANHLQMQSEKVGQTTIYRYVNMLVNDGLVRKYIVGPGQPACFQYVEDVNHCETHSHLRCNDCSKVLHVDSKMFSNVEKQLKEKYDFRMDNSKLLLYGICSECDRNLEGEKK
ncbi:MAG: transcriptional repressor [Oscillospiraceae bacterium]|nr:transcriptional repressor [Oscillospiraceae bacterium]